MSGVGPAGVMPPMRDFGWPLKARESSRFDITKRDNGQFTVVLNHALLRGVRAEMIAWWFRNFTRLRVSLTDVAGYEGETVPAYLLWHPSDHLDATLIGRRAQDGAPLPGETRIHIREAMQYLRYGWKYPVDAKLTVAYVGGDGWAMGKRLPVFGPVMMLRIHFKDVVQGGTHLGVHYHYEVVIGVSGNGPVSRFINRRMTAAYGPEFFTAWHTHNVIEVGVFENFLPALYAQRADAPDLRFSRSDSIVPPGNGQTGFDAALFEKRVAALAAAPDPYVEQRYAEATFL
ncbi:MAG: hypothetical protein AAFQ81_05795 [Pseudomonadota bacterium]